MFDPQIVRRAIFESFKKLDPRHQVRNPVMFTVFVGSILTTGLWIQAVASVGEAAPGFILGITAWLWFTVLFANFAEAMAEGRGKAQADALRAARATSSRKNSPSRGAMLNRRPSMPCALRKGDVVLVEAGDKSRSMAKSSRGSRRSTKARSPAKVRPSFAKAAEIAAA